MKKHSRQDFLEEIDKLKDKKETKRKNSKAKGSRGENDFVKLLNERFKPNKFIRTPGSGALVGGKNYLKNIGLEEHIIDTLSSDIVSPKDFRFQLEHKNYNKDAVPIGHLLRDNKNDNIQKWWIEVITDALKTEKEPMLVIKLDRAERFCVLEYKTIRQYFSTTGTEWKNMCGCLIWKHCDTDLFIVELAKLFALEDKFWLKNS